MCEIKNSSFLVNVLEVFIFVWCENLFVCVLIFGKKCVYGEINVLLIIGFLLKFWYEVCKGKYKIWIFISIYKW